ncbi:serine hydrolase domain-containing protein, partial [Brucellaceae bacterium C25G]
MSLELNWSKASELAKNFASAWSLEEPGGAIVCFDANGVQFAHAGGLESLSTRTPFSADTVVRYASVTKHVFCAMVLQHSDIISLDDRLGQHLPELQTPLSEVTVGQALDMTAGLPDTRECLTLLGLSVYTETEAKRLMEFLATFTRLNFEAGTEISYSNTGYRLVETILERHGFRFNDYVEQKIAASLGTYLTAPDVWNDTVLGLAPGYWNNGTKWQLSAAGLHISASGSLAGSAKALAAWGQALVCNSHGFDGVLTRLSADRHMKDGRVTGYGLGVRWNVIDGQSFVGHGGSHPGYKTYLLLDPATQTGIAVVANREDVNTYKIARDVMANLHGLSVPEAASTLPKGLYVTEHGPYWVQVGDASVNYLDSEDALYDIGNGVYSSTSPSSPVTLYLEGDKLVGEIGYAARTLSPVTPTKTGNELDGHWTADLYGAQFDIVNGEVIMGIGPTRNTMPLEDLGNGRWLFTLYDGPWTKRVCL